MTDHETVDKRETLTVPEAAELLGVNPRTVYVAIERASARPSGWAGTSVSPQPGSVSITASSPPHTAALLHREPVMIEHLMIPALIAAIASMVVAIIATIAVVSHREMDDRNRRLCSSGVVVGIAAIVLSFCLNPEIIRPTLTCLAYVLAILAIVIAAKVTGIATKMTNVVVRVRRHR